MNIPKEFKVVAVRDDRMGTSVVSFNPETKTFFLVVDGISMGPLTLRNLKALRENINDVIDLRGKFVYIESYNSDGTQND